MEVDRRPGEPENLNPDQELQDLAKAWVAEFPAERVQEQERWLLSLTGDSPWRIHLRSEYEKNPRYQELWARTERWLDAWQVRAWQRLSPDEQAKALLDAGYHSVSNKYREVARVPPGLTALEAIRRKNPQHAADEERRFARQLEDLYRRMYADDIDKLELTFEEFTAFKRARGEWSEKRIQLEIAEDARRRARWGAYSQPKTEGGEQ